CRGRALPPPTNVGARPSRPPRLLKDKYFRWCRHGRYTTIIATTTNNNHHLQHGRTAAKTKMMYGPRCKFGAYMQSTPRASCGIVRAQQRLGLGATKKSAVSRAPLSQSWRSKAHNPTAVPKVQSTELTLPPLTLTATLYHLSNGTVETELAPKIFTKHIPFPEAWGYGWFFLSIRGPRGCGNSDGNPSCDGENRPFYEAIKVSRTGRSGALKTPLRPWKVEKYVRSINRSLEEQQRHRLIGGSREREELRGFDFLPWEVLTDKLFIARLLIHCQTTKPSAAELRAPRTYNGRSGLEDDNVNTCMSQWSESTLSLDSTGCICLPPNIQPTYATHSFTGRPPSLHRLIKSSGIDLNTVMQAFIALLNDPDPSDSLRADLGQELATNRERFFKNALAYTEQFAEQRPVENVVKFNDDLSQQGSHDEERTID
ncbi:unnamed protein product, partial [Nesidiocoris tenuis]